MKLGQPKPELAPTAKEYADAFYALETQISIIARHAKLADYLLSVAERHFENKLTGSAEVATAFAVSVAADLYEEARKLDEDFLAKHNDLVGRENAAGGLPS